MLYFKFAILSFRQFPLSSPSEKKKAFQKNVREMAGFGDVVAPRPIGGDNGPPPPRRSRWQPWSAADKPPGPAGTRHDKAYPRRARTLSMRQAGVAQGMYYVPTRSTPPGQLR